MKKCFVVLIAMAVLGVPAFALAQPENQTQSQTPQLAEMTDSEMDQVTAGQPDQAGLVNVNVEDVTVAVVANVAVLSRGNQLAGALVRQ
jgi:broad specificity polyphosphatase/5'/3'-nucleotidase SurE